MINGMMTIFEQMQNPKKITAYTNGNRYVHNNVEGTITYHCQKAKVGYSVVKSGMDNKGLTLTESINRAVANKGNKRDIKKHAYKGGFETVGKAAAENGLNPSYIRNTMKRKDYTMEKAITYLNARKKLTIQQSVYLEMKARS